MIVYIDGYNLYYGLLAARLRSSRWLDLMALSSALLEQHQDLTLVRYFTTRVRKHPEKLVRQNTFLDALAATGGIEIDFGHFLAKDAKCNRCGHTWPKHEEKRTDVNIAVRLLDDAYDNRFDTAIVMSGDSDLVPPIEAVRRRFPTKRMIVASPPERHSVALAASAHVALSISAAQIRRSRLPAIVQTARGVELHAPARAALRRHGGSRRRPGP